MDESTKHEAGRKLLKRFLAEKFRMRPGEFRREAGNFAKEIGIPVEHLEEFLRELLQEVMNDFFAKKS